MESKGHKNILEGMEIAESGKNNGKTKNKTIYNLKEYERNSGYCETCPRDIGKKCNCKW